jgi:hypothetical protein
VKSLAASLEVIAHRDHHENGGTNELREELELLRLFG